MRLCWRIFWWSQGFLGIEMSTCVWQIWC
uniref:Uncharacterized protein n=1 Tax=Arundo donax TaxID=35708 RepID=A0A0A9A702_ARUDO